jgi:cytochrome c-type biogenesis protein CcmH/NrfF
MPPENWKRYLLWVACVIVIVVMIGLIYNP